MKKIICLVLLFISSFNIHAQITKELKLETGYSFYRYRLVYVEPGPDWKGYNIRNKSDGMDINLVYGFKWKQVVFTGIGLGYVNYNGINGYTFFGETLVYPLKTKIKPQLGVRFGLNHIDNQYVNGSTTSLLEFNYGFNFPINRFKITLSSAFSFTQQVFFVPVRLGFSLPH